MKSAGTYSGYLRAETMRVIAPYLVLGCLVFLWAFLLLRTRFPELGDESLHSAGADHGSFRDLFRYSHFVQAVLAPILFT
jgi:MFS transporter, FHS family, L-fucose permease